MANLAQRAAERSYGIDPEQLTPPLSWSAYALRKAWNRAKEAIAPWWAENSKEAYSCGLANLATALGNWSESRTGRRRGPKVRFPRFKGKRTVMSCRFTTGAFGLVDRDRRHVKLPRIGTVRTHESTRKLARHVQRGTARIRSVTVSHRRGRWFVSLPVEISRDDRPPLRRGTAVGVDLGIKSLAVLSTGEVIANPRHLDVALRQLRRWQRQASRRQGPDKRAKATPSGRWRATQAGIARLHTAVANARRDGLHKIAGVGLAELRRQIEYKAAWSGVHVHVADRWYPSSKTCSDCGAVKAKLRLSERTYTCHQCGLVLDRDLNAARNLAALVSVVTRGDGGELRRDSPMETHLRPALRGQRVPPREGLLGQRPHRKERAQDTVLHVS